MQGGSGRGGGGGGGGGALTCLAKFTRCREEVEVTSKGVLYSDCAANGIQMKNNQVQIKLFSDDFMTT